MVVTRRIKNTQPCSIDGCEKPTQGRGWCAMHYQRFTRHGDPMVGFHRSKNTQPCSIEGCGKPVDSKGWCKMHYTRYTRHGDPETNLRGEPAQFIVDLVAQPEHPMDCILWPFATSDVGYGNLTWQGVPRLAHRLVCELVHGPPPTPRHHAAHLPVVCHQPACINPNHLRWASASENSADRLADGTLLRGGRGPMAKLTDEQALSIFADPRRPADVATDYPISTQTVIDIRTGRSWAWLTGVK